MASDALTVVNAGWDAWMGGDIEGFLATLSDDAVMTLPGTAATSGEFHGPSGVGGWAKNLFERSGGTIVAKVEALADAGGGIVLTSMTAAAAREGRTLDQRMLQRYEVQDGKVKRLDHALMDIQGWHDFWA